MAIPNKQDVINYLKHDRTLTGGKNLYNRFANKSLAKQQSFNRFTSSDQHIKSLCFELCKLVGIPERQFTIYTKKPVTPPLESESKVVKFTPPTPTREELLLGLNLESESLLLDIAPLIKLPEAIVAPEFGGGLAGNRERMAFLKSHNWEHEVKKKEDLDAEILKLVSQSKEVDPDAALAEILEERKALIASSITNMPDLARRKVRLFDQFSFLREKDCPDEFKILVSDMITAYHTYMKAQPGLHDAITDEDRKAIAATVKENYLENKMIWDELEHYESKKVILGEHPIFKEKAVREEIAALSTVDLTKKIGTLKANVTRNTQKSTDESRTPEQQEASAALAQEQKGHLAYAEQILATR